MSLRFLILSLCILASTTLHVLAGSNEASKEWLAENAKKNDVIVLPSGLQYKVLRKGKGKFHPTKDSPCECHYKGTLIDGTQFDSSYDRGSPTTFAPNQVIAGWTEAMQLMVEGDKWEMYIPSELGYGDRGSPPKIGGGDALIFTMEIIKIQGDTVPAVTCNLDTLEDCDDKEKGYVEKIKTKFDDMDADAISIEIERIQKSAINNKNVSEKNREWGKARVNLLEQLLEKAPSEDEF